MDIFTSSISMLEQALNYSALKQKVIANNIANVDTPNYKSRDVSFQKLLESSLSNQLTAYRTDRRHFPFQNENHLSSAMINRPSSYNENGNSVDMDKEMSDLASNQIYYNAITELISGKFSSLNTVIRGGK
ncbi:MAG: flagellar basal body rod protein FlgB [Bacillales bacterium]|nr:flagellar basal body rod protein FlgB [Bacillales bacterium]